MSSPNLTPTSYLVLGLVGMLSKATSYDMKRIVEISIGHFWSFPHSQLYAEPPRLVELGLLSEQQEQGGRRRRTYSITPAGRQALRSWLADDRAETFEMRYLAMLKLFFGSLGDPDDVARLAKTQEEAAREHLAELEAIGDQFGGVSGIESQLATLRMGLMMHRAAIRFWKEIAENPPAARD